MFRISGERGESASQPGFYFPARREGGSGARYRRCVITLICLAACEDQGAWWLSSAGQRRAASMCSRKQ